MTTTTTRSVRPIAWLVFAALLTLACVFATSCTHKHSRPGADGADGIDGVDGTDGLGFDFVRDIDGSELVSDYWIGDASCVLPEQIIAAIPADDDPREGVILYLGNENEFYRYYLLDMRAGSYCVIDRDEWEVLGTLDFVEDSYLVAVELSTLDGLGLLTNIASKGFIVKLDGPVTIDAKRTELRIGSIRIRMYGRD